MVGAGENCIHSNAPGGNLQAPYGVSFSPMLVVESGQPFNVTIGQDLNGDNQFNDRPAFATAASTNVIQSRYGAFDPAVRFGGGEGEWRMISVVRRA